MKGSVFIALGGVLMRDSPLGSASTREGKRVYRLCGDARKYQANCRELRTCRFLRTRQSGHRASK